MPSPIYTRRDALGTVFDYESVLLRRAEAQFRLRHSERAYYIGGAFARKQKGEDRESFSRYDYLPSSMNSRSPGSSGSSP